jgi:hypothetical protein
LFDEEVVWAQIQIIVCAEPKIIILAFGCGIDPATLVTAERALLVVAGDNILA